MKGQVSTELLIIVALVLLIFIPLIALVYFKANEANQQIGAYQAELTVSRIASLANSVGSLGTSTSVTTDVFIPPGIVNLKTENIGNGAELSLTMESPQGQTTPVVQIIRYPIVNDGIIADSSFAGSWMRIKISSEYVNDRAMIRIERA